MLARSKVLWLPLGSLGLQLRILCHISWSAHIALKGNLGLLFSPGARPGDPVGDWSMAHAIGMGRIGACRIILECTLRLGLSDLDPVAVSDVLKALLRMKAASEPSATEEQQFTRSL